MTQENLFQEQDDLDALLNPPSKRKKSEKLDSSAAIGLKFENEINEVCELYRFLKIADIQYFEVATRFIPKDPKTGKGGFTVKTKKTGFDFIGGIITPPKNTIYIECKSTKDGKISVWQDDSGIKRHQIERMRFLEESGFVTMFLWQIRKVPCVYKFTPSQLLAGIGGSKELTIVDCENLRFEKLLKVKNGERNYYDFLGKIE